LRQGEGKKKETPVHWPGKRGGERERSDSLHVVILKAAKKGKRCFYLFDAISSYKKGRGEGGLLDTWTGKEQKGKPPASSEGKKKENGFREKGRRGL